MTAKGPGERKQDADMAKRAIRTLVDNRPARTQLAGQRLAVAWQHDGIFCTEQEERGRIAGASPCHRLRFRRSGTRPKAKRLASASQSAKSQGPARPTNPLTVARASRSQRGSTSSIAVIWAPAE